MLSLKLIWANLNGAHVASGILFLLGMFGASMLPAGSLASHAANYGPWVQVASYVLAMFAKSLVAPVPPAAK